jgi:hypothetical protein
MKDDQIIRTTCSWQSKTPHSHEVRAGFSGQGSTRQQRKTEKGKPIENLPAWVWFAYTLLLCCPRCVKE